MTKSASIRTPYLVGMLVAGLGLVAGGATAYAGPAASIKSVEIIPVPGEVKWKDDEIPPYPKLKIKVGTGAIGLKAADFLLKSESDGKPVAITGTSVVPFKDSDEQLDIFILVQGTVRFMGDPNPDPQPGEEGGAINGYYNEVKQAIDVIAKARTKRTNVGLYVYGEKTITKVPQGPAANVGGDSLGIQKDFAKITTKALQKGIQSAYTTLSNAPGRRVLFIIGDGEDQDANVNINDEIKKLTDASVEVYVLGANPRGNIEPKEAARLGKLGKLGDYQVANQAEQIPQVAETLANEVNNVYTVEFPGYQLTDGSKLQWDGDDHDITIQAKKDESEPKTIKLLKWQPPPPKVEQPSSLLWLWILLGVVGVLAIVVVAMVLMKKPQEEEEVVEEAPPPPPMMAPAPPPPAAPQRTMMIGVGGGEDGMPVVGWIVPMTGPAQYQTFKLSSRTVIGKNPDANVIIEDPFMSGQHAEIVMSNTGFTIMDKGSANGVTVNAKRVPTHELVDNDVFTLGKTDFKFKSIN
jgi:hypothetical protein